VRSEDDLTRIAASSALESALGMVAYLGEKYKVAMPSPDQGPGEVTGKLRDLGYPAPSGPALTVERALAQPQKVVVTPAKSARLTPRRGTLSIDILALIVTIGIGVVTGLSAFYFGKTFGTVEDYVTVVAVGAAGQTLSKTILDRLSVFIHDISPVRPTTAAIARPAGASPTS
jgi:hypothetical protein